MHIGRSRLHGAQGKESCITGLRSAPSADHLAQPQSLSPNLSRCRRRCGSGRCDAGVELDRYSAVSGDVSFRELLRLVPLVPTKRGRHRPGTAFNLQMDADANLFQKIS